MPNLTDCGYIIVAVSRLLFAALPVSIPAFAAGDAGAEIVCSYLDAVQAQQAALRGAQMEVSFDASLSKLGRRGHVRARRSISEQGQITYQVLDSSGDKTVTREVIARYLSAETEARDSTAAAITPANYTFRLKTSFGPEGQRIYAFQLTPRKKLPGLFKGELWVDGQTGMPVRESGEFVKNPSVFIKHIRFVRTYQLRDGLAIPEQIESTVETRLAGRAELLVRYSNFAERTQSCELDVASGRSCF